MGGRGWSERALDPDPHDLLIRGWAATSIIEPCRPWLSWVRLHCLWGRGRCRLACYPPAQSARAQPAPAGAAAWLMSRRPVFARQRPPPCTLATVRPPTARCITRSSRWVSASCPATPDGAVGSEAMIDTLKAPVRAPALGNQTSL